MLIENVADVLFAHNFLPLEDVYALVSVSKRFRDKLTSHLVKSTLCVHPLRGRLRYNWWIHHLLESSIESPKLQNLYTGDSLYHYLSLIQQLGVVRASPNSSGQIGEVMRDVKRTFPTRPFFFDGMPGQDMLARILQACVISQPDVGYCQGMNFVVGSFILSHPICSECPQRTMEDYVMEVKPHVSASGGKPGPAKFWAPAMHFNRFNLAEAESEIYVALMCILDGDGKFKMQCAWRTGMPVMKLYNYEFDRLLKWNFPQLHSHFIDIGFSPEILLSQWFLTFFIYTFPLEMCMDMWDYIMAFGWPAIFSFALGFCGIIKDTILDMDLEELSIEMRKWKCDKFKLPEGAVFTDIVKLANSIGVSDSELLALQEAFASKMVADAAASTNTVVQPHLGVKDVAQLTKSIARYLKKSNSFNSSCTSSGRAGSIGLMNPFSHSGFLETPIEDFNSVSNYDAKVQMELAGIFTELVELNKQVESDKEVYLSKIVGTGQKLDSLKNEFEVLSMKEKIGSESVHVLKSDLAAAIEAEAQAGLGGSIHNSLALGLSSSHGKGSRSINTSLHGNLEGALLVETFRDVEIQRHTESPESSHKYVRKSPRSAADIIRGNTPQVTEQGLLNIVAVRKIRNLKHSPDASSPNRRKILHHQGSDHTSSTGVNYGHIDTLNSISPSRAASLQRPPPSPSAAPAAMKISADVASNQPKTRRYIRGKSSPSKPLVKQSSFEDIDLGDPADSRCSATDTSSNAMSSADKSAVTCLTPTVATGVTSRWSFFSKKSTPPPPPPGGLLHAVKTGRRASQIIEHDSHHSTGEGSTDSGDTDRTGLASSHSSDLTSANVPNSGKNILTRTDLKEAKSDQAIFQMMSASTTKFIPDPSLHPEAGGLGNVLGIAVNWAGHGKKDSLTLQSELEATEKSLKEIANLKLEISTCIEEETEKKDKFCEQLQLLVEEMYNKRTAILHDVIKRYVMCEK